MSHHLDQGVTLIPGGNGGRFPYSHSILLEGDGRILLDTGSDRKRLRELAREGIDLVIFTHYHRDHVYYAHIFEEYPKAAHFLDAPALESVDAFLEYTGFQVNSNQMKESARLFRDIKPIALDRLLHNGETLDLGKVRLKLLHTPGHTPGHSSFLINDDLLFAGDLDLSRFGPWYGNVKSSLEDIIHSIKRLQELQPPRVVTSHSHSRVVTENISEKFQKYYEVIEERDRIILDLLQRRPAYLNELVGQQVIYRNYHNNENIYRFERSMIYHHLCRLEKQKQVALDDQGRYYNL